MPVVRRLCGRLFLCLKQRKHATLLGFYVLQFIRVPILFKKWLSRKGVGDMQKDVNPCKGCICTTCAKSEYNGAMYLCPVKACDNCEKDTYIVKRSYCDDYIPLEDNDDSADDFRLW